ncbi:MAG TPA: class I SAM-dependent methyltransferase [Thermoanaerobaculia bacterium]|nr:class I SAM-dependent methyltransferase [Thermoanaerobaculia bacterium]
MNLKGGGPEKFGAFRSFLYQHVAAPSLAPLHRRIASEIPIRSGRLLDAGCGPGSLDRMVAAERPGLAIVGIDKSEAMVRRAAPGASRAGLTNLEFRRGAVESLSLREEFDSALSVLSFHHWEEPETGLESVHRALKPGGRFWIYEGDPEASREDLRRDQRPLFGWLRLPERLVRKGLRGHGFTAAEADRIVRPVVARTSFRTCEISRSGSLLRIAMARQS